MTSLKGVTKVFEPPTVVVETDEHETVLEIHPAESAGYSGHKYI